MTQPINIKWFDDEMIHPDNLPLLRAVGYDGPGYYHITEDRYLIKCKD